MARTVLYRIQIVGLLEDVADRRATLSVTLIHIVFCLLCWILFCFDWFIFQYSVHHLFLSVRAKVRALFSPRSFFDASFPERYSHSFACLYGLVACYFYVLFIYTVVFLCVCCISLGVLTRDVGSCAVHCFFLFKYYTPLNTIHIAISYKKTLIMLVRTCY